MGHKHPRAKLEPHPSKTPKKAGFDENALLMRPAWRIGHMEMCDPFGWHEVDVATLEIIRERLKNFETMSIVDFFGPKKKCHLVETDQLCKEARSRLSDLGLDDLEALASLRVMWSKRIWAMMDRNVFTLLWWDPEHRVCPGLEK
jgi:hypothetical protein